MPGRNRERVFVSAEGWPASPVLVQGAADMADVTLAARTVLRVCTSLGCVVGLDDVVVSVERRTGACELKYTDWAQLAPCVWSKLIERQEAVGVEALVSLKAGLEDAAKRVMSEREQRQFRLLLNVAVAAYLDERAKARKESGV